MPLNVLANDTESIETPPTLDEVDPADAVVHAALTAPLNPRPALLALDAEDDLAAALEPRP